MLTHRFSLSVFSSLALLLASAGCAPANVVAPDGDDDEIVDADNDGYTNAIDCNDQNAAVHPNVSELDNGIDDNCDGQIDEGYAIDHDGDNDIAIKVTASGLTKIDFSYGYCSDKDNPADCADWHQSVVSTSGSVVMANIVIKSTGVIRFNSSFFVDGDNSPDHWLCEGYSNPTLTAKVDVWVDGLYFGDGDVFGVPYAEGCSAALDIYALDLN